MNGGAGRSTVTGTRAALRATTSMTTRLVWSHALLAAVIVIAFTAAIAVQTTRLERQEATADLDARALGAIAFVRDDRDVTDDDLRAIAAGLGDDRARTGLYSLDGQLLRGTGPARLTAAALSTTSIVSSGQDPGDDAARLTLTTAVDTTAGPRILRLSVADTTDTTVRRALLAMAAVAVLLLTAAVSVGILTGRRLARPVAGLAQLATGLGDGTSDPHQPPPSTGIRDVDDIATALHTAAVHADTRLAREQQLTADLAHQLRTPVTAATAWVETAQVLPASARGHALDEAAAAIERLRDTIEEILTLARDTHGTSDISDLSRITTAVVERLDPTGHITTTGLTDAPPVQARPAAVRHILEVLLTNALTHGQPPVTITATTAPGHRDHPGTWVQIHVIDHGHIDHTPDLFTRRPQPHDNARPGDSDGVRHADRSATVHGIGLHLAASLAQAEGGDLQLNPDAETTDFVLRLPVAGDHTTDSPVDPPAVTRARP